MYPLTAAIIVQTKELWDELQKTLSDMSVRVLFEATSISDWNSLEERIQRMSPDVLILEVESAVYSLDETIRRIRAIPSGPQIVTVHSAADPALILTAMRAGAIEYLFPPLEEPFRNALGRLTARRQQAQEAVRARDNVVGFVSAKGGCGGTTIACHVASFLPEVCRGRVLLADLDLSSGTVQFVMKAKSPYSLYDVAANLRRLDLSYWRGIISNGYPGLDVLSAPNTPASKDLRPEQLRHVIEFARTQYDWVIADLGRNVSATSLGTIEGIDRLYVVTTGEVVALHQAKHMIRVMLDAGYSRDRLSLVLNRAPKRMDVTLDEIEQMLGLPLVITIPNDYQALEETYTEGRLLTPESALGRHYLRLTCKIAGVGESPRKSRFSLFG